MPDYATLTLFALAAFVVAASPGPAMVLIASRSAAQGRKAGLITWAGIAAGTYFYAFAAAFGLSQLFLVAPIAYDAVLYGGAAYLLYLAWGAFTLNTGDGVVQLKQTEHSISAMFRQGFLTNLLNPVIAVFVLVLFPQFVEPEIGSAAIQIMIFATVLNAIGFFIFGGVILASSRVSNLLSGSCRIKNLSQYVLGAVFAGLAARLVLVV